MPWYQCRLEGRPKLHNAIQDRFALIVTSSGAPPEMLLVEQEHTVGVSTLWMRLPDTKYLSAFPEFKSGDESKLPKNAALLVGHNPEFEKLFDYGQGD
jgi:hypothetical protein